MIKIVPQGSRTSFNKLWGKYQMSKIMTKRQVVTVVFCYYFLKKYIEKL